LPFAFINAKRKRGENFLKVLGKKKVKLRTPGDNNTMTTGVKTYLYKLYTYYTGTY